MNKWQETVKRVAKQHPGKSLREILPIAKKEYKKVGHHVAIKSRKGHKGRRSMNGGSAVGTDSMDGGVQAFDGDWNGEFSTVGVGGQAGGSKRRGSKRRARGSKRRGSKRRGSKRRGSKRRGSKRRGSKRRGSKRRGSKRRGSKRR